MKRLAFIACITMAIPQLASAASFMQMPDGSISYLSSQQQRFAVEPSVYLAYNSSVAGMWHPTEQDVSLMPLVGVVTMPFGSLVSVESDPRVYLVGRSAHLHWVTRPSLAVSIAGASWASRVKHISAAAFSAYTVADPIVDAGQIGAALETLVAVTSPQTSTDTQHMKRDITRPFLSATRSTSQTEVSLLVPTIEGASPTIIQNGGTNDEDSTALAMCDQDCSLTLQVSATGTLAAFTTIGTNVVKSNDLIVSP